VRPCSSYPITPSCGRLPLYTYCKRASICVLEMYSSHRLPLSKLPVESMYVYVINMSTKYFTAQICFSINTLKTGDSTPPCVTPLLRDQSVLFKQLINGEKVVGLQSLLSHISACTSFSKGTTIKKPMSSDTQLCTEQEAPLTLRRQRGRCRNIKGEP